MAVRLRDWGVDLLSAQDILVGAVGHLERFATSSRSDGLRSNENR